MTILEFLRLALFALFMAVYAVGAWVVLTWAWERLIKRHYRLWFARKYGVPVPILIAWEDEWRRQRGFTD